MSVLSHQPSREAWEKDWLSWEDFVRQGREHHLGRSEDGEIVWHRTAFDAPLWILFSSGTTGRPKWVSHMACRSWICLKKKLYQAHSPPSGWNASSGKKGIRDMWRPSS